MKMQTALFSILILVLLPSTALPEEPILSWGSSGNGDGQFSDPTDIALDGDGFVYVSDGNGVQKFTTDGVFVSRFGPRASAVAASAGGFVYIGDDSHVYKYTSEGVYVTQWGSSGSEPGQFRHVHGIATDEAGNVYVAEYSNRRIQAFDQDGTFRWEWGDPLQFVPGGLAWRDGVLYVNSNWVYKFDSDGNPLGQLETQAYLPVGMSVDASGAIYLADGVDSGARVYSSGGDFLGHWGGTSEYAQGLAVAEDGLLYLIELFTDRVFVYAPYSVPVKPATWGQIKTRFQD